MTVLELSGKPVTDFSDAQRKVKWEHLDIWGDPVFGSLRTIAHLDATSAEAERRFGQRVEVLQGSYNTDVPASAGTHDFDAVLDVFVPNLGWRAQEGFFRHMGWAAWWRFPPAFGNHVHMVSLGYTTRVGIFVPGQVADYYNHAFGLAGQHNPDSDGSWHPKDIDSTIFDFAGWRREMEEDMGYKDWSEADRKAMLADIRDIVTPAVVKAVWEEEVGTKANPRKARVALRMASNAPALIRDLGKQLKSLVLAPAKDDE